MSPLVRLASAPPRRARGLRPLAPLLAAGLLLAGCGQESPEEGSEATPGTGPTTSAEASPSTSADPGPAEVSSVYFVVDTRAGLRLAREPRETAGEPGIGAVEAMIEGPEDPDYTTTWDPATEVLGVSRDADGTITVDLSAEARRADVGSPGAAMMVQQLVWTVTESLDAQGTVRLLVEGEPAGELWGAVSWDEPVARDAADDVRMLVGIDSLSEGERVSAPFTVTGEANAFEATVPWRVLDAQGAEVDSGFATAAEGMTFAPYSFDLGLEPGTYTVEVAEDDPSGGEAGEPMRDTRTITVE